MHATRITLSAAVLTLAILMSGCAGMNQDQGSFKDMAYPELQGGPELTSDQHERMGDDLYEHQSPEMAYVHFARALASAGSDPQRVATLQVKKGLVLFSQGLDEAALKEFQAVLAAHPDHALANEAAGAVYLKAGLTREAKAHFEHAAALDPDLWRTQQYLGMLASRENRHADAVRHFNASLELRPGQPGTLNNLGVAHLMNSDYEPALSAFRRALAAGAPQDKTYNNIGLTLARMGRIQEALQTFRFGGDDAKAHNNLGYVLMLQGDNEQAIEHFQQAIELSPSYYAKAFSNLKQAKLALSFQHSQAAFSGPVTTLPPDAPVVPAIPSAMRTPAMATQPHEAAPVIPAETRPDMRPIATPAPVSSLGYVPFQNASASAAARLHLVSATSEPSVTAKAGNTAQAEAASAMSEQLPVTMPEASPENLGRYGMHVASFKTVKRTVRYVAELREKGIETMVMDVTVDGEAWHRVLAGRYATAAEAATARPALLTALGLDNAPIQKFIGSGSPRPPQTAGSRAL